METLIFLAILSGILVYMLRGAYRVDKHVRRSPYLELDGCNDPNCVCRKKRKA